MKRGLTDSEMTIIDKVVQSTNAALCGNGTTDTRIALMGMLESFMRDVGVKISYIYLKEDEVSDGGLPGRRSIGESESFPVWEVVDSTRRKYYIVLDVDE